MSSAVEHTAKAAELRRGVVVMVVLAVLTLVEYLLAVMLNLWVALAVIALVKAAIVINYYMHLPRVFHEEGGH